VNTATEGHSRQLLLGIVMKKLAQHLALAIVVVAMTCGAARAEDQAAQKRDIEAFMNNYLRLWNAHDAATITQRIYRLEGNNPWATKEGLQAEFDRLKGQGYDHSDISSVIGCVTGPDTGQAELRFVRLKTDGSFMPPKDRVSLYYVKRFDDGWRVTGMKSLQSDQRMECSSA
jgi:hypothetical protein